MCSYSLTWLNGSSSPVAPPWNWFHAVNGSCNVDSSGMVSVTFFRQHYWSSYSVKHTFALSGGDAGVHVLEDGIRVDNVAVWNMTLSLMNTAGVALGPSMLALFGPGEDPRAAWMFPGMAYPHGGLSPCARACWDGSCGDTSSCRSGEPQALPMDWGTGAAGYVIADASCSPASACANWTLSALNVEGWHMTTNLAWMEPDVDVNITFSFRFGDGGGPTNASGQALSLVADVLDAFVATHPFTTPVIRGAPVGAVFGSNCGATCTCASYSPQDCPNPRGWSSEVASNVNITDPVSLAAFQAGARDWVNRSVAYCLDTMGPGPAQCAGILFWSLEGSEYSWDTYVGAPDMLPVLAPEMDAIADELLGMVNAAGLRIGMTLRPQLLTPDPNWNASVPPTSSPQKYFQQDFYLPDNSSDVVSYAQNIIRKAKYAIGRWNASMFYVDTTANKNGVLPIEVWQLVTAALPHITFFPEESEPLYHQIVAPLQDNWGGQPILINAAVKSMYPSAYGLQLQQFEPVGNVTDWIPVAKEGDLVRIDPWYDAPENRFVKAFFEAAGTRTRR